MLKTLRTILPCWTSTALCGFQRPRPLALSLPKGEVVKKFPGIDCGSCGSPSCLALAEDVVQGYTRETDCLSLLKEVKTVEAPIGKGASGERPSKSKRKRR